MSTTLTNLLDKVSDTDAIELRTLLGGIIESWSRQSTIIKSIPDISSSDRLTMLAGVQYSANLQAIQCLGYFVEAPEKDMDLGHELLTKYQVAKVQAFIEEIE